MTNPYHKETQAKSWHAWNEGHNQATATSQPGAVAIQWPTMPPSKGQSPVLFEDGYAEGWAKCLEACQIALDAPAQLPAEPTPEMIKAARDACWPVAEELLVKGYKAMLPAAPTAPKGGV
jgi:hypothetical protein